MILQAPLVMPREPNDAQLVFRAEQALKTELEAVAETLDRYSSKILRDILADGLPKWRARADEEMRQRAALPHGITPDVLEKALAALLRKWAEGKPVAIELHNILSAESKALWVLLSFLWKDEPSDSERKAAEKLLGQLAKLGIQPPPPRRS
jgi:hypothetical protein